MVLADETDSLDFFAESSYAESPLHGWATRDRMVRPPVAHASDELTSSTRRAMRTTLIDWLLQVHMRYHMLPETLWIAINILDRFCSVRCVSLTKFQLVGVTAMFVAAKYEEIMAPR